MPTATYRAAAFVEAARRIGVELTVASEFPSTLEQANPAALLTLDLAHPQRAAQQVRAFAATHPVAATVGVDDDTAVVAATINEALGTAGNPVAAVLAARDKHLQRVTLARAGIPVPRFALHGLDEDPEEASGGTRYPCVLKPLRLSASRGVIRADDADAFGAAFRRIRRIVETADPAGCDEAGARAAGVLVEDYVPGVEVALEGLLVGARLHVLAIFDKPDPLEGPYFEETIYVTPSRLPEDAQQALARCADAAARALGLVTGPIHAELRWNARGPWLIELAARPIGGRCSAALRFGKGERGKGKGAVTLEEIVLRQALRLELPTLEREPLAAGVMMIPIPRAGTLREVRHTADARAVPLVDDVAITIAAGGAVVPLPEGSRYLGFIFARGPSPVAVEAALREAHRRLDTIIDPLA
ncbi:MAG: ATP-grasp domain-containing protein [Gemmatimonadales bacterium]